jgi:hypothetical protein
MPVQREADHSWPSGTRNRTEARKRLRLLSSVRWIRTRNWIWSVKRPFVAQRHRQITRCVVASQQKGVADGSY